MNAVVISGLIHALASIILGSGILEKVQTAYHDWADKEIAGEAKKAGALAQLKSEGVLLSKTAFDNAIQFAHILATSKAAP